MSRILVVEDDEAVRETICVVLEAAGHDIAEATNGEEGLRLIESGAFDLAVVDIWMPRLDGVALLRQARAAASELPFIIVSGGGPGHTLEHASALCDAYGANSVLIKPFENRELLEAVDTLTDA